MHPAHSPETAVGPPDATILLVDDEPAVRRMLADFLDLRGYGVRVAADAEAALDLAAGFGAAGPRLLITDIRLPGLSGLELAARLQGEYPELAVVFMSGFAEDILSHPGRTGPRCRILEKPFRTARLVELVSELLA